MQIYQRKRRRVAAASVMQSSIFSDTRVSLPHRAHAFYKATLHISKVYLLSQIIKMMKSKRKRNLSSWHDKKNCERNAAQLMHWQITTPGAELSLSRQIFGTFQRLSTMKLSWVSRQIFLTNFLGTKYRHHLFSCHVASYTPPHCIHIQSLIHLTSLVLKFFFLMAGHNDGRV